MMPASERPGLQSVQCMRAVAALLVLSCHVGSIEGLYTSVRFFPAWGMYGVDLFFVISGFVMTYVTQRHWGDAGAMRPFLLRRICRIYPVYWEFTAVILAVMWLKPSLINGISSEPEFLIKSLLLWPQMTDPALGVGWSLVYEMYFYLVFCLVFLLPARAVPVAWAAWVLLLAAVRIGGVSLLPWAAENQVVTSPLAFEFLLGCALAWGFRSGVRLPALPLLVFAVLWCIAANAVWDAERSFMQRVLCWGIPSGALLYAGLMLELRKPDTFPAWLRAVGDASYSLYLCHSLMLSAFGKLWQHLHLEGVLAHLLFIALAVAAPIAVALLNYRYVERPIVAWYHGRLKT